MQCVVRSVGLVLIGLGLCTSAVAHPTEIKPQFPQTSVRADSAAYSVIDCDASIADASAASTPYWIPVATLEYNVGIEPIRLTPKPLAAMQQAALVPEPHPSAGGFVTTLLSDVPQPGVLALVAMGAALCRFGSSFLRIRR